MFTDTATTTAPATESKVKIITYVLDDDADELEILKPYLDKVCANDLQLFTEIQPFIAAIEQGVHIAIIDYRLSAAIDGIEVGQMVLEKNPLCFLIMVSGYEDYRMISKAMNAGFRGHVDKNDKCYYAKVAELVERQLPMIRTRISFFEKYKPKLEAYAL